MQELRPDLDEDVAGLQARPRSTTRRCSTPSGCGTELGNEPHRTPGNARVTETGLNLRVEAAVPAGARPQAREL